MRAQNDGAGKHAYVSEFEQFLDRYRAEHPDTEEDQLRGWYLLWDRRVDFDELNRQQADTVPCKSYVYD